MVHGPRRRLEEVGREIERAGQEIEQKAVEGLDKVEEGFHAVRRRLGLEARDTRPAERGPSREERRPAARRERQQQPRETRASRQARRRPSPTPEQRAYREARRRANRKIGVSIHGLAYFATLALILVATRQPRITLIVALAWGIGFSIHYFVAVLVPELRARWIREEVERGISRERRATENRHDRSLADLSASIAHEIRNPIAAAKSLVQQMGEDPGSEENIQYAGVALEELDRVERSISHLLRYARDEELRFEAFGMAEVVESALATFRDRIQQQGVELRLELDAPGAMEGDAEKMRRVVINLVGNALDALAAGQIGGSSLEIALGENLAGSEVWLRMRDNGPGIDPETLSKIFDPFFTTKDGGTGLGLALSRKLVEAHGGTLEVESAPETGTEFLLTVPKNAASRGGSS